MTDLRQSLRWLAIHGAVRGVALVGMRRGDPQARLIADAAVSKDPLPLIEELRSRGRIVKGHAVYMTVDHQIAHELLRSDAFRVAAWGLDLPKPLRWLKEKTDSGLAHPLEEPSLLSVEPPDHTRLRTVTRPVFTKNAAAAMRGATEETTALLLDHLSTRRGVVDLMDLYCARLPVAVLGEILGVPDDELGHIRRYGELGSCSLDFAVSRQQYLRAHRGIVGFNDWLDGHLERLGRAPGDDLLSRLAGGGEGTDRLTDQELRTIASMIFFAGFETTVNLLGGGIRLLLDNPHHLQTLAARPQLWPSAVEEILRFDSPVQMTLRVARRDTELAGTRIRRGQIVVVHLGGANRDPGVFDDPHRFDIERPNAGRHLAFSTGRHFCLGAALARLEAEVGLRSFFERYPYAQLSHSGHRRDTHVLRGWSELPVTLGSPHPAGVCSPQR